MPRRPALELTRSRPPARPALTSQLGRVATVVMTLCALPAQGEVLVPLDEAIAGGAAPAYPYLRCAGLYFAVAKWGGRQRMGEDWLRNAVQASAQMSALATVIHSREIGSSEVEGLSYVTDVRDRIAELYIERWEANYAASGHAWAGDPLFDADSQICRSIVGE